MSDSTNQGDHPALPPQAPPYSPPPAAAQYPAPAQPPYPAGQQYPPQQPYPAAQQHPGQQQYPVQQQYPAAQPYPGTQQYPGVQPYAPSRPTSGLAVTSLITGIAGIVLSWAFLPLLASIAAVITGHMALKQTRTNPALGGRGMAIAGLILGYVGVAILALTLIFGILSLFVIGSAGFVPFLLS
ncbi:DUF4190 domain-containing protein [Microbacterium sp.]|uniref:DUF4190 domain-containing protein n=1 Tax=Microbacterium sp. TaxID=51671 RepID=UPI002C5370EA|nr:DUF4190 domain-containing protein [Microbacterium sp.]HWK77541.1 DUF4190 domain-containing protein [Microbacterium sp.]